MFFFQFQSIIYRHAMSFHMENHLSLSRYKLFSIYSRSADILHTINGVKRARFGVENVGQPETVTITETVRMSSVTQCPVAGLARALGISSLVSRAPGITIPWTSTNN